MAKNFFIVGAQRSGTTYLSTILEEHPEIEMAKPRVPEPKFFLRDDFCSLKAADYESRYFGDKQGAIRNGEKSTSYIEYPVAAQRIASWYPDAQIIFLLRNPIERAVSNYHFSRQSGLETLPIERALAEEEQRRDNYDHAKLSASPFAYLKRGEYIEYIRSYEKLFARSQIIVLIYEEFVERVQSIQHLYRALNVRNDFIPGTLAAKVNASRKVNISLPPALRCRLGNYFAPFNSALEQYLGRKLDAWRT
jgi:hypothetical protein